MRRQSAVKDLSLRWLELFQICAHKGSLQAAAKETGLTISTVSHHLRNLEDHLGVELFNHSRRPMVLTPKGEVFLRNIDQALYAIRKAKAEASAGSIAEASLLRVGSVEDFDSDIMPELAVFLSQHMPSCNFMYLTDSSHTIADMLRDRHLDLGITTSSNERMRDLQERPLLRDPFVVVLPRGCDAAVDKIVKGQTTLPFLRFSGNLIIARQIESQMRRLGLSPASNFECSNNQTLMAMVAAGAGWTITTPLLFSRAKRFQKKLSMHRFPGKSFSRSLSIVATPDCSRSLLELVDGKMRALITEHAISRQTQSRAWLAESFRLIT
ncbi:MULTISPECIES: LysR family transcriptional regulator [unclassified Ruegeria]|uniref:LysR family transcriptional regulator n=1 Tax=unclassified Ruegeria TaxID=2625375 RepID=UPI0014897A6F|nr:MULTISPECIES: LysR family transcriptional regulator [unclassified Ruegeria]NOD77682.1 LysR family transcriptional regulator [Ruegeria sp. HKCCD4332]NOD89889.1 LysR family transcriptional regulator [Ruegeria sp. HKCCD4318]NOD94562.1 LysR family transcriptional regulator [Ruegeria sp. HKCCD4884]NOE14665.1 LysR family transcriptional regulator [Ruegeria sp. HKCCD4318-2]NOG10981.1 LysR family transcriptional regulator [Ruegeria sp. HKCCD4315]